MARKVKFHLPGLRYNFPLNMIFLSLTAQYPQFFMDGLEIGSFYGEFPCSLWNGGRVSLDDQCDAGFIRNVIRDANMAGIPIRYTYTNPLLTEKDLDDKYCNFCMREANNGKNQVLVVSPVLEEYIRKTYPDFTICSSTCKEIRDIDKLNEELKKDYGLVVLDYNFNNKFDILRNIEPKDKVEVLINPCCEPECRRRGAHYKYLATQQRTELENRKLPPNMRKPIQKWECKFEHLPTLYSIAGFPTFISRDKLWNVYVPMGYSNFKIEGRTSNLLSVMDTYCYYMAKPEHRDAVRMLCLLNLENRHIITVNKPRRGTFDGN